MSRDARWRSFEELLTYAKANPGKVNYGTPGVGTDAHVTMERVARQRDIKWTHIPFRTGELTALLGGHVDAIAEGSAWAPLVNNGELRLLVTFGSRRSKYFPAVPTLKEAGIDVVVNSVYGLAGPKGMEPVIVNSLHDAFKKGMEESSFISTVEKFSQEPFYLSSAGFHDFAMTQIVEERRVVEELGLKEE